MNKQKIIKEIWSIINSTIFIKKVREMTTQKPKDEGLQLLNAVINLRSDTQDIWFTALAVLCLHEKSVAGKLLKESAASSGNPITNMTKAELIDAIASGSKLTKADAG